MNVIGLGQPGAWNINHGFCIREGTKQWPRMWLSMVMAALKVVDSCVYKVVVLLNLIN